MKINVLANMNKKVLYTTIALIAVVSTLTVVYATVGSMVWEQEITWTYTEPIKSITVDGLQTLPIGAVIGETIHVETYVVTNTGTVPVVVTASTQITGASANWDINPQTIAAGDHVTFTLTLTITGTGSCTVIMTAT